MKSELMLELDLRLALPLPLPDCKLADSELELSLALPNCQQMRPMRGFDRNDGTNRSDRKRGFNDAFDVEDVDDEHGNSYRHMNSHHLNQASSGKRVLKSWPPIEHARRKNVGAKVDGWTGQRRERWVKVKMEGDPVGRKVDLSVHHSYRDLFRTLAQMFPNQRLDMRLGIGRRKGARWGKRQPFHQQAISYEDGKGNWKFVGDVPWVTFIRSAERLKIFAEYADS